MPEPKSHAEHRGTLESILRRIPGFRGYLEKSYRRESDALERQFLADRLERGKAGLETFAKRLLDAGRIDDLPSCDRLRGQLDKLIARIRGAMQGYSGMFDLVQIQEALLDRVYEHDLALMDRVEGLSEGLEKLAAAELGGQPLTALATKISELEKAWDHRTDMLQGLE